MLTQARQATDQAFAQLQHMLSAEDAIYATTGQARQQLARARAAVDQEAGKPRSYT